MRLKALAGVLLLSWSAAALAADAKPSPFKFEFHGFAAGTVAVQDGQANGLGQLPFFAIAQPAADRLSFTGDVRESRFNFSMTGPKVMGGATPKAVMEIDWFNNDGSGGSPISLLPRVRVMYAELNWGANRILFGQNYDLTTLLSPVTITHIAQPVHLAAGNLGFRRPGIQGYHQFGDLKDKKAGKVEFAWELGRTAWTDTAAIGASSCTQGAVNGVTPQPGFCPGEASGLPTVEARLAYYQGSFTAFVAGHFARVDRNGVGLAEPDDGPYALRSIDQISGNAGAKGSMGPITLAAAGYVGKNTGTQSSSIGGQLTGNGDVHEWGAWGQVGFAFTKHVSLWGFAGVAHPNEADAKAAGGSYARLRNVNTSALLQYRDGGYAIGLEYLHMHTNWIKAATGSTTPDPDVNQLALTGVYFF